MRETKFKQTEVGMIPCDWEVKSLENICNSNGIVRGPFGGALKKEIFVQSGYKVYEQRNAIYQSINIGNYYISKEKYNELLRFAVKADDFIISCSGTIGKLFQIPKVFPLGIINQALLKLSLDKTVIVDKYFFHYFQWDKFQLRIIDDTQGGAMKNLVGMDKFRQTAFALPPLEEQKHIAQALSDVDAVITTTEKLIAKKKALKQGAMQTLLSGKMRIQNGKWIKTTNFKQTELGPIPQEWEVEKLSQICDKFLDGDWIEADDQSSEGIRLIQTGNIGNGQYLDKANRKHFISEATFKRLNCTEIFEGDVLVSRLPDPVGRACILPKSHERRITAVDCTIIRFSNYNPILFVNYTQTSVYQNAVNECLSGSTRLRISRKNLGEMLIPVPPTKEEQTAIATVLSDMDSEIAALETKLAKYRQLKTGMMQQLLTGKIRLV